MRVAGRHWRKPWRHHATSNFMDRLTRRCDQRCCGNFVNFQRKRLFMFKIPTLPLNWSWIGFFRPKFCIFGWKFSDKKFFQQFSRSQIFRVGNCPLSLHLTTVPLDVILGNLIFTDWICLMDYFTVVLLIVCMPSFKAGENCITGIALSVYYYAAVLYIIVLFVCSSVMYGLINNLKTKWCRKPE